MEKFWDYIEGHMKTIMNHEKTEPIDLTDDERKHTGNKNYVVFAAIYFQKPIRNALK